MPFALFLIGVACVIYGAFLVSTAHAWIVSGAFLVLFGLAAMYGDQKAKQEAADERTALSRRQP